MTLAVRIIPCLDVKDGVVVKGVQFKNHEVVGDILQKAKEYSNDGADELVFYDITASSDGRTVSRQWIYDISKVINIPFCVAGGIKTVEDAEEIFANGADKISINSPALINPKLIDQMAKRFGSQSIVIGMDSKLIDGEYQLSLFTGDEKKTTLSQKKTTDWVREVIDRGAGEIVLNCMSSDGKRDGYDIEQLSKVAACCTIPLVASGGAGKSSHFIDLFQKTPIKAALAASVFHKNILKIASLKEELKGHSIPVRL